MPKVVVIGGITVDIEGVPNNKLISKDSNPGEVNFSYGGVGKNIAQNMVKLDIDVSMLSAVGNDLYGESVLRYCKNEGIKVDDVLVLNNKSTAVYMSILDHERDMEIAIINMDTFDEITWKYIKEKEKKIIDADLVVIDTNMSKSLLDYIVNNYKDKKFFLDPVSTIKAEKAKESIGKFTIIKPNKIEAEKLSGIRITDNKSLEEAGKFFIKQGVENVFITLGKEGVYYHNCNSFGIVKLPMLEAVSATGAGDAFSAGVIYGYLHGYDIKQMAVYGCAAASIALLDKETVSKNISIDAIKQNALKII